MPEIDPLVWALRKERLRRGLSYGQLAELSGLSESTLKRIESGRSDLRLSQYRAITRALGVSDLDMTLQAMDYQPEGVPDINAALRMIPLRQRQVMIQAVLDMAKSYTKK
jgi:transcriptional regulator with XRE-family HTH domain